MVIFGLGGLRNDPSCALVRDGDLLSAIEQRKLDRDFRPGELPREAIRMCLEIGSVKAEEVDVVAIARPLPTGPESDFHLELRHQFPNARVLVVEHHTAHAASAFFYSGFDQATVLTLDRTGDFRCGARWHASGAALQLDQELYFPDSLGDLYGRVTALLGFESNADEHKVQWMSASGKPVWQDTFAQILPVEHGWLRGMNRSLFDGDRDSRGGFGRAFYQAIGLEDGATIPPAKAADLAASMQSALEKAVLEMAGSGRKLCLAGGLFWNSTLVAALERSGQFEDVFVQPAAGNTGTALGAVAIAWHQLLNGTRRLSLGNFCLGPEYDAEQIKQVIENCKLRFRTLLHTDEILSIAIEQLKSNRILAWMHGRMEYGARALGNRSILASPVDPYSAENLNSYIKHREPFRKFAASVPAELAGEYFDVGPNARFLATVGKVREQYRQKFASVTLGEDAVRVHTVSEQDNPLYWRLLHAAAKEFELPVLFNTSFNLFGDPLVCTPRDAVRSFYSSGIDAMIAGYFFLEK